MVPSFSTFSSALADVYGGELKYTACISTPRFAIMYVATGLSIPPERSETAFPFVPTGSPPGPIRTFE